MSRRARLVLGLGSLAGLAALLVWAVRLATRVAKSWLEVHSARMAARAASLPS